MVRKRILSAALGAAMLASVAPAATISASAADDVKYKETPRIMEELNRGLVAVHTTADTRGQTKNGVVLSWRLLGNESLSDQAFDIYRDGRKIHTTGAHDATYYFDASGNALNKYKVVKAGASEEEVAAEEEVTPSENFSYAKPNEVGNGNSHPHSFTYVDIPISMPTDIPHANSSKLSDYKRTSAGAGGANDASIGDLDGDGDYEIVLKWDPNDSRDAAGTTVTGDCILDAYEIDPNNDGYKWRIDLGQNITAGAHSSQFMVYDFDHDGKAEIATQTAEGSYSLVKKGDGTWEKIYVTTVGDTPEIQNGDNSATHLSRGKNIGADYLTIFDGETGRPLKTTAGIPLGRANGADWGDSQLNRSSRYLAAVAYLDGVNPYYIAIRGMYNRTVIRAYSWDGETFKLEKEHIGDKKGTTMYGEGNHNLSVADIDNDGKDEIVYGSACLDDDFKTVLGNTKMGHGDAMHVSDFNNDGWQEVFSVKEDKEGFSRGTDFRVARTGNAIWSKSVSDDNGRGLMGNIDDTYAASHPEALALGWAAAHTEAFNLQGNAVGAKPSSAGKGDFCNFLVYWDGDLSSELLDANIIQKYDAQNGWTKRFYGPKDGYTLSGQTNNDSKRNYSLVADLWGDWREEIIMPVDDNTPDAPKLRIFTSLVPTTYRLTTLMHDSQYRCAIAWQNVGYNQPPHTSYYIGSAALAKSGSSTLNYLDPATPFDKIMYPSDIPDIPVDGIEMKGEDGKDAQDIRLERSKTYTFTANVTPGTATKKGIRWTSSDPTVATVDGGVVKAVGKEGNVTITAEAVGNPDISKSVTVTVFSTPVTGVSITNPETEILKLTEGDERTFTASVEPQNASEKTVEWRSTNPAVVEVDKNGKVTAKSMGLATIFAKTVDGGFEDAVAVNVLPETSENKAGDDAFVLDTGEGSGTFTGTATGATLTQDNNSNEAVFHKTVQDVPKDQKAKMSFRFTTGGTQIDGSNWNWKDHEFSFNVKLLGANNENILTFRQPFNVASGDTVKAGTLATQAGAGSAQNFPEGWTEVISGNGNISGSAKRWQVDIEFDYANNKADAVIYGYDNGFASVTAQYEKSFDLTAGTVLKKLEFSSHKEGTGGIYWRPIVEAFSYEQLVPVDGVSSILYRRGEKNGVSWTESDISETTGGFKVVGGEKLNLDAENHRIWFDPTKPGASYSAEKTFDIADNALVEYDIDWYFGISVGENRDHSEYIQIGDKLRFGWKKGYVVTFSKDAGETWETDPVFTGSNTTFTKNIHLTYDKKTKRVKSLTFDGKTVMANESLDDAMNKVMFGLNRITGSSTESWNYPNGLENISVSQFDENGTPQYDVKFVDEDGSVLEEKGVDVGTYAEYGKQNPTKDGDDKYETYTFEGWEPDPAETKIFDNTVFTARYTNGTPKRYTVTLDADGGTIAEGADITEYTYGTAVTLPDADKITKTGHTFEGWFESKAYEYDRIMEIPEDATGNKEYYAKWTPNRYPVTLNLNDGKLAEPFTEYVYGVEVELPVPTRTGHRFDGWYTDENFGGAAVDKITATDEGEKVFYAKWTVTGPFVGIEAANGNSVNAKFIASAGTDTLIGAVYDGDVLLEIKSINASECEGFEPNAACGATLTFENDVNGHKIKLFLWDGFDSVKPVANEAAVMLP